MTDWLSYKKAGVNMDAADAAKRDMARSLEAADVRVLNRIGAFACLYDARFAEYEHPVLVFKMEEPGSKQAIALQHGRVRSICYDLVNHLVNDVIVMGAKPLCVQDVIVCGKLEKEVVTELVDAMAAACREQGCTLTGGETSEQPGVVTPGTYILAASIVGVVERSAILDGSRIEEGDAVLAVVSNGLHTNGYSLVRAVMASNPEVVDMHVEGRRFLEVILEPHRCYYHAFKGLFGLDGSHGIAHITGGGLQGNLNRILPDGLDAAISLDSIRILPIFKLIRRMGNVPDDDMLRTFNLGVGMTIAAQRSAAGDIQEHLASHQCESYVIGEIVKGKREVTFDGVLHW